MNLANWHHFAQLFRGRATRSEYWTWFFIGALMCSLTSGGMLLCAVSARRGDLLDPDVAQALIPLFALGFVVFLTVFPITLFAAAVRRLHDTGRTARTLVWLLAPPGWAYLLYLFTIPGDAQANRFGPPSAAATFSTPELGA